MDQSKAILLVLIVALFVLSAAFVAPFAGYFMLAIILAYLLVPIQRRLERRVGRMIAAALVVAAALVIVVIPLAVVLRAAIGEGAALISAIREGAITLSSTEERIVELTGVDVDLLPILQSAVESIDVGGVFGAFTAAAHALLGFSLALFLLYYFLKDRGPFLQWLRATTPVDDDVLTNLFEEIDRIMAAVLIGHVLVAVVQGVLAGLGLVATGIPNAVLWTAVMIVLSLLPVVGSFLVWGPAAAYLFLTDATLAASALIVWGIVVVGVSDDYLRPIVVDRYAQVNPSVIVVGVVGGIYVLGVMGIFFGPVIVGALRATLDVYREEFVTPEESSQKL